MRAVLGTHHRHLKEVLDDPFLAIRFFIWGLALAATAGIVFVAAVELFGWEPFQ